MICQALDTHKPEISTPCTENMCNGDGHLRFTEYDGTADDLPCFCVQKHGTPQTNRFTPHYKWDSRPARPSAEPEAVAWKVNPERRDKRTGVVGKRRPMTPYAAGLFYEMFARWGEDEQPRSYTDDEWQKEDTYYRSIMEEV